jgi:carboxypeptidase Q
MMSSRNRSGLVTSGIIILAVTMAGVGPDHLAGESGGPSTQPIPAPSAVSLAGPIDPAIDRIRDQGLNHSQVMATLDTLCNVIGPRLTASPNQIRASNWTRDQLARWGLTNSHLEPWGEFGRGWTLKSFELETIEPTTVDLVAVPKAWSPGINGPVHADVVYLDAKSVTDLQKYHGKLEDKVVLLGSPRPITAHFEPQARRMDDDSLRKLSIANSGADIGVSELMRPTSGPASAPSTRPTSRPNGGPFNGGFGGARAFVPTALAFCLKEGAILVIDPSTQGDGGTVYVAQASLPRTTPTSTTESTTEPTDPQARRLAALNRPKIWADNAPPTVPQATMAAEQYNRMISQIKAGEHLKVSVDLRVQFTPTNPAGPADTVAEIPGSDLKDQVVMVGGHLDSWHGGTGATDNAAGAASAMEAIRILRALDLHPRRTIRVALWTGEEEGLLGSHAYVVNHFGKIEEPTRPTTRPAYRRRGLRPTTNQAVPVDQPATEPSPNFLKGPDYEKLSVYFNLDNGTGRIRGIYAQGNRRAADLFQQWLTPVHDLGASTVTLADTGSTDHISFDDIGLPGFQFLQDPIEYGTRTHHSTADVYERLQPDDLRQASTIMAIFLWDAANMDQRFPRKPMSAERSR